MSSIIFNFFKFSSFVYLSLLLLTGCKKEDNLYSQIPNTNGEAAKFFKVPAGASPAVKRIAGELQRRNEAKEFVIDFALTSGYPVWNKVVQYSRGTNSLPQSLEAVPGIADTTVITIPLVLENTAYVNGYIEATLVDTTITNLSFNVAAAYKLLQTTGSNLAAIPANKYATKYFLLNKEVFGYKKFQLRDSTLFRLPNQQSGHFIRQVEIITDSLGHESNSSISCYTLLVTWNCGVCGLGQGVCVAGGGGSAYYEFCSPISGNDDWGDSGGSGTGSGTGTGTPGGHGTGGTGSPSPQYPCPSNPALNCPPPSGGIGWIPLLDPFDEPTSTAEMITYV
ncbi:MAG: hypothetical protein EOO03_07340, partial [Chitinophagaceae bacterium]